MAVVGSDDDVDVVMVIYRRIGIVVAIDGAEFDIVARGKGGCCRRFFGVCLKSRSVM